MIAKSMADRAAKEAKLLAKRMDRAAQIAPRVDFGEESPHPERYVADDWTEGVMDR